MKVVTGDNDLVTQHVCRELGLPVTGVLTGADIAKMDDRLSRARVETTTLFCRVNPSQKDRVILALKRRGHTVGYLGDGINDAPPLHSADVGISVQGAVDVAREAADLILLEDDLGVLHQGVLEGRRTFSNILKYINMGTSSNFGNMFSMAGGALLLPFLPMRPVQILLNNLLYDVSEIAIPLDTVDDEYVRKPRQWDMKAIRNFMFVMGPISSLFDFLTFFVLLKLFHAGEALFQTGWFIESMATQVLVIFVIRTTKNPFRSRPNGWLTTTSLTVVLIAAVLPLTPIRGVFRIRCAAARRFMAPSRQWRRRTCCGGVREAMVLCPYGQSSGVMLSHQMDFVVVVLLLIVPQLRISAPPELAPGSEKTRSHRSEAIPRHCANGWPDGSRPPDSGGARSGDFGCGPRSSSVGCGLCLEWRRPGEKDEMVVLFPARTPSYPNGSLEDVLRHEVAHVLIGRASAQRPIPRWFNEGLAMSVERGWRLQDEGQFVYQLAVGSRTESRWIWTGCSPESQPEVTRAYALSGALVHDLLQRHGARHRRRDSDAHE